MRFVKMQGAGNDYVYVDCFAQPTPGDVDVVIPLVVIEELDGLKTRLDDVGRAARTALRTIEELRVRHGGSLATAVPLDAGDGAGGGLLAGLPRLPRGHARRIEALRDPRRRATDERPRDHRQRERHQQNSADQQSDRADATALY